jgi:hypothetical protein
MNSYYDGFTVEVGDTVVNVVGGGFSVSAHIDNVGKCLAFDLVTDFVNADGFSFGLQLEAEQFSNLNKVMSLVSGEQLRRTVTYIRSQKEVK